MVLFDEFIDLCGFDNFGNVVIVVRNGGVELVIFICLKVFGCKNDKVIVFVLKVLVLLICGMVVIFFCFF